MVMKKHWSLLWMTTRGLRMCLPGSQKFSRPSTIFPSVLASGIAESIVFQWFSSSLYGQFHSELVEERGPRPCFVGCLRVPVCSYLKSICNCYVISSIGKRLYIISYADDIQLYIIVLGRQAMPFRC